MYKTKEFVDAYASEKEVHPFRVHMERHTIYELVGDVRRKKVLDIACGTGSYSRLFCELGAEKVVGIDYSKKMIEHAIKKTPEDMPIEYLIANGESFRSPLKFDFVFHSYFLNYASSIDALAEMSKTIYLSLIDGGSMLGIVCMLGKEPSGSVSCCDFYTNFKTQPSEGEEYEIIFRGQNESIKNYNWSLENYEKSLYKSGFKKVVWHKPSHYKSSLLNDDEWSELIDHPVFLAVTAKK
ncbi:class I SAM-dependent methyltransferase [Parendozoicomonas sp. Alg238-R29]|uniref:class I SAM-dependent methyltransferase n=1 Tax=Parendozoicomonas sp. Alg238-R29 TaxID=2993446 RepID=UPI00248E3ABC|nr:class I SAM-dependent methyltransferase [Parendozoicomonas sp. Alg238-R29]